MGALEALLGPSFRRSIKDSLLMEIAEAVGAHGEGTLVAAFHRFSERAAPGSDVETELDAKWAARAPVVWRWRRGR